MELLSKIRKNLLVLSCTFIIAVFSLLFIGQKNFSGDEIATIEISRDFGHMIHMLRYVEGNMWLYYFFVHFWLLGGTSEVWVRFLSTLFAIFSVPLIYSTVKLLMNEKIAKITTILLSVNIFFIQNAQNARSYTLLLFLTTASTYFFVKYIFKPSYVYLFCFTLFNVLAFYAHLYAIFVICAQFLSLFFISQKLRIKELGYSIFATLLLIMPFVLSPSIHSGQLNWISKPSIKSIIGTFIILSNDFPPIAAIYALLLSSYGIFLWRKSGRLKNTLQSWSYRFVFLWILFPITTAFIFSLLVKPMYSSMYFFICIIPFTLLIAVAIDTIQKPWLKKSILVFIIILSCIRLYGWYVGNKGLMVVIDNNHEDWDKVAVFLSTHTKRNDGIVYFPTFVQDNIAFYAQKQKVSLNTAQTITYQPFRLKAGTPFVLFNKENIIKMPERYSRIWYIHGDYLNPTIQYQRVLIENILYKHYILKEKDEFSALTVYRFEKK